VKLIFFEILHSDRFKHGEQRFSLAPLPIRNRIHVTNFGTNSTLNSSSNFKGIQTFLKNSDKFLKILSWHDIIEYEFTLTHLYSNIESYFTSGNRYLVNFRLNHLGNL
jgi:hypothetical protein